MMYFVNVNKSPITILQFFPDILVNLFCIFRQLEIKLVQPPHIQIHSMSNRTLCMQKTVCK